MVSLALMTSSSVSRSGTVAVVARADFHRASLSRWILISLLSA